MKKLLLLVLCAFSVILVNAQTKVNWGLELGLGMSTWMGDGSDGAKAMFNPNVGVKLDIPLTGLVSFQTGLTYASKGVKSKKVDGVRAYINQNYLEMPLLAAYHLGTGKNFDVVLAAGPYPACGVGGKVEVESNDVTVSWSTFKSVDNQTEMYWKGLRRFDAGIRLGGGLDFDHWQVGLNGEFGLCRVVEKGPRNLTIFATVGFKF